MPPGHPFVALTDKAWFDFFVDQAKSGVADEVNFWSPTSTEALKDMRPGEPVFFRLKKPWHTIAGYGLFAHFSVLDLDVCRPPRPACHGGDVPARAYPLCSDDRAGLSNPHHQRAPRQHP
jgi:hypothetical protein